MHKILKITIILFLLPFSSWAQVDIDSTQEHEISYSYEHVYSELDFETIKRNLLSEQSTNIDSIRIGQYIDKFRKGQNKRLENDTSQYCIILLAGDPLKFTFEFDGEKLEFNESDFQRVFIPDCAPHFEDQCIIITKKRTNEVCKAKFQSPDLSYFCDLDLSYSKIKIEHNLNILLEEISIEPDPKGGPPIPVVKTVFFKGAIEISHTWSR